LSEPVAVSTDGAVRWITLNRPENLNAFDDELGPAFIEALREASDEAVRCVVVTGEGKAFCAGENLRALAGRYKGGRAPELGEIIRRRYNPAIELLQTLKKPVLAAVNGVAAGAGVSVALACDYRLMAEEASFVLAFSKVGLVPDSGATWLLPRYIGIGRALELSLSGEAVSAKEALDLGLVNRVASGDQLKKTAEEVATSFAEGPTLAYGLIKDLVWKSGGTTLSEQLAAEADAQAKAGASSDHLEGVTAFFEKRRPGFTGR
jgi:2-(1,2-epoxy-1,2-dihydrophenyl)acetyl-CoA isomerase